MVKPGYKQTKIGVIPEGWDCTAAKHLMKIETGSRNTEHKTDIGKYPFFVRSQNVEHIDTYHYDCEAVLTAGDGVGTGKVFHYYTGKFDAHQRVYVMSNFHGITGRYFYNYFSENFGSEVSKYTAKSSVDSVRHDMIADMIIPLPSISEQERIAEALSDVDELIFSLEKLIAKKKAIKQGTMQELLTGKKRLPGFTGEWVDCRIGAMGEFYSGLSGKSKNDFDRGDAHFITFLNVLSNIIIDTSILASVNVKENESQNAVQKGDLFFNTSSETPEEVGMCAVLDEELENTYLNSFCFGFRLNDDTHNPLFLSYYLNSSIGRKFMSVLAQGATRYNLSKNNFAETVIRLPSKEEQTAIASILSDMDNEIEALERKLAKTQQIKQGMMQQLLTGKIRLVGEETIIDITVEQDNFPKIKTAHNHQFDDAIMIAAIVNYFYSEKYPLGRKKVQKLLYLLRRKQEADTSEFKKKAAGPYADEIRYKGGEPIAKKNGYISATTTKKGTYFSKGKKIDAALGYVEKWQMQSDIDWLVSNFKYVGVNNLELYATIDMAICDLRNEGVEISVDSIKELIRSNFEWKAKLKKSYFSDDDIARAINISYKLYS